MMQTTIADNILNRIGGAFRKPQAKGMLLLFMVVVAMLWANLDGEGYHHFFNTDFSIGFEGFMLTEPLHIWINDGLMAVFFFLVGLEIKKELIEGSLSSLRASLLPVLAAIAGMVLPALIFLFFNYGSTVEHGWGIPMATDIAFTLGVIALLGSAVPDKVRIFLTALATVDDLGAILVIAFFLTPFVDVQNLVYGGGYFLLMLIANKIGIRNVWFYGIIGIVGLWTALLLSGIHATLAGVLGSLAIPAGRRIKEREYHALLKKWEIEFDDSCSDENTLLDERQEAMISDIIKNSKRAGTPLQGLEHQLSPVVNYLILPLFALANAGIVLEGDLWNTLTEPLAIGIILGLVFGKFTGIAGTIWILVKGKLTDLPEGGDLQTMTGTSLFAGIGFTMSLFIAELSIQETSQLTVAKLAILFGSLSSVLLGLLWFRISTIKKRMR